MEYKENYQIEFKDCDENRRLKLPALVDLMMQVSEHQLDKRNAGTDDLAQKGLGWVVTQYHFDIKKMPQAGDQVILSTFASGYNRFFEYRDFGVSDSAGNPLVVVKSQWVMLNLKERHMVPADVKMMEEWGAPLLKKMPRFPRLMAQDNYEKKRIYRARYDDLDTNHHVTNSHYFSWFIDMLDRDFLKNHVVETIDIKFDKEVYYGERVYSCMNLLQNDNINSSHAIEAEDGTVKAICELKWHEVK
ncbi:Acyl-ACP thioesterase [Lactobacillus acidophilus ATCC 4796]|uniref:acyl-[acyl-carrier-protein] thioesterase n=1 Tax=Lactobacillus acidophilus TaxID=1579 RepID=UPI00019F64DB|nr:acyl-ACP thioesterase domain-containing protein [Lactobacillus acidophilus]EEJ76335.1 Acyl-ACP thioesterase [Lactobacillus acidophilus ATCC 4796]MCT3608937.1 acyl-[acyl-carrier-protein] thioesterase [Lactobacillus acidophilus]